VDYGLATFHSEKHVIFTKCGTPGFVAPEIITYDEKEPIYQLNVDTFSVGVIMHILLVGEQSFPGKSRNTILNKNKECKIDYKSKKYEEIAGDGIDLMSKLL
jgi:serine/threonine protein kinase